MLGIASFNLYFNVFYKLRNYMFKHLKYIDGTSDKFWEIQTSGDSHTVTYGRNGTDGQSKTKTFDTEEACLADAEKLIREKTKKGYSEDGTVEVQKAVQKDGKPVAKTSSQQRKEEVMEAFRQLIRHPQNEAVLPFLQEYAKGNLELLKKEIRGAKRFYASYVNLDKEPEYKKHNSYSWGQRGTKQQIRIINLLALGTFSLTDTNSWPEFVELLNTPNDPQVAAVLEWAQPDWLSDYLAQQLQRNDWLNISYDHLREWERRGMMQFNPELYVSAVAFFPRAVNDSAHIDRYIEEFCADDISVKRDIPLVFEYPSNINAVAYKWDYNSNDMQLLWHVVFQKLLAQGKMERGFLIHKSLEIQTKSWNNSQKGVFRELLLLTGLDEAELLKYQHTIFPMFHVEESAPINFAINLLKPVLAHPDFDRGEFLSWISPIFMRADLKGAVKTLMIQLDKVLKDYPQFKEQVSLLAADTFMIPDLQLQDRATKFILKHQEKPSDELTEKLTMYASQMLGSNAQDLKPLMGDADEFYSEEEILSTLTGGEAGSYVYSPDPTEKLQEEITLPSEWNDILFQLGQVLHSKDSIEMEILMNAWTLHLADFPADYKQQLTPYLKQLRDIYSESHCYQIFSHIFYSYQENSEKIYVYKNRYAKTLSLVNLMNDQMQMWQERWRDGIHLEALSLPTHKPFWVAPHALADRIIAHEKARVPLNLIDLSIALSRAPKEQLVGIEEKIDRIEDKEIVSILKYAFGLSDEISVKKSNCFGKIVEGNSEEKNLLLGIWATIARINHPDGVFSVFENSSLANAPTVIKPFDPKLSIQPHFVQQYNYQEKVHEPYLVGNELIIEFPVFKAYPKTLLAGLDIFSRGSNQYLGYYASDLDVRYVHSLLPQNTDSLAILYTYAYNRMAIWGTKDTKAFLEEMLYPFYLIRDHSALYVASSFFNADKTVRAVCVELFIQTVEQNRFPVDLVANYLLFLMNGEYGPIGRLADVLEQSKDISAKHNQALLALLLATLSGLEIKEKMPTNLKKLFELFYDLQQKSNLELTEHLKVSFKRFEAYKSLQPLLKKILK